MDLDKYLRIEALGMKFGAFEALSRIDLIIEKGEFVTLIGHSGCGKSTLLNLVAGLLVPTDGGIILAEREVAGPGPDRGVVFQNHSLLPWLTCFENVFLAVERVFQKDLKQRTEAALELVGLSHAAAKYPNQISGGMKQRVGIARALAMEPKVLLLDEPFGALDALTRDHLQQSFIRIRERLGLTAVFVTHDMIEALLLADRIAVLERGRLVQIGTPRELLEAPANDYVERLLETPRRNARALDALTALPDRDPGAGADR